jgi:hypothetical protein
VTADAAAGDPTWRKAYFTMAALVFAVAAAAHLYWLVTTADARWFHALFVGLDAILAALMIRRPFWLAYLFPLFAAEQLYAHGGLLAQSVKTGRFDTVSCFIVIFMPLTAVLLFVARGRQSGVRSGA